MPIDLPVNYFQVTDIMEYLSAFTTNEVWGSFIHEINVITGTFANLGSGEFSREEVLCPK